MNNNKQLLQMSSSSQSLISQVCLSHSLPRWQKIKWMRRRKSKRMMFRSSDPNGSRKNQNLHQSKILQLWSNLLILDLHQSRLFKKLRRIKKQMINKRVHQLNRLKLRSQFQIWVQVQRLLSSLQKLNKKTNKTHQSKIKIRYQSLKKKSKPKVPKSHPKQSLKKLKKLKKKPRKLSKKPKWKKMMLMQHKKRNRRSQKRKKKKLQQIHKMSHQLLKQRKNLQKNLRKNQSQKLQLLKKKNNLRKEHKISSIQERRLSNRLCLRN